MIKKVVLTFLLFIILIPTALSEETEEFIFTDMKIEHPNYVAIKFLKERGIIKGYPEGDFRSYQAINRVEALTIIEHTFSNLNPVINETEFNFPDVKESDWFYNTVKTAFRNSIIKGYANGYFHPENPVVKAEVLQMAFLQQNRKLPTVVLFEPYSDVPVDIWYAPLTVISKNLNLFLPSRENGGELKAGEILTRGEFAQFIYQLLQSENEFKFGRVTWYADSLAGRGMASGNPYDPRIYTTAHKTLPFGTNLSVKNLANGKEVTVMVHDRGPYATGVELDLSRSAFEAIASASSGIIKAEYKILNP